MPLRGHLAIPRDILGCLDLGGGATGIWWVEVRDAAKHPGQTPQQRALAPNVSRVSESGARISVLGF